MLHSVENSFGRSKEEIVLRLNQICLNVAVHAVNNLRSADNVTVMIIIIQVSLFVISIFFHITINFDFFDYYDHYQILVKS